MQDQSHVIRPFMPEEDLPRLAHLLAAVEAVDHDGEDISEETIHAQLTAPGHDLTHDRWVAVAPTANDTLLGWGFTWLMPGETLASVTGATHPAWRERGIGAALLNRAIERASTLGATGVGAYVGSGNEPAAAFLRRRGFAAVSANTLLRLSGEAPLPAPALPPGYLLHTYASLPDTELYVRAVNRCYEGQWGHHTVTAEIVGEWLPTLDQEGIFILLGPDGDVAGTVRAERYGESVGYVDAPGVTPEHRWEELHVSLLLAALWRLRERAPSAIDLESWGDAQETLATYEMLGFEPVRRAVAYERAI